MLYVFLVDTGTMLTFEMELAMESVEALMRTITLTIMIPFDKQVLIMQDGEALDPDQRICDYSSAGTENNPIFLFSKSTIESSVPPSPSLNLGSESTLKEEVEISLRLPPTYETLVSRAQLALKFQDMATELSQSCVSMVNEQYLQRKGWCAVIANLEKIASTFQTRATILEQNYSDFLEVLPRYKTLLDSFPDVIRLLSKIPVFGCLLQNDTVECKDKDVTLLDWINAQDRKNNLEDMVRKCADFLEQIQKISIQEIREDRDQVLGNVSNTSMKEIGGLEERLNLLSKLCDNSRKLAQEQSDMAQGFSQNQIRAQNIGDPSVLPDLCSSHQKQLSLLMNNHSQLRDLRRRCAKAKDELSGNLHARLRWVMVIEKKICDCDNKLVLYHESMKRLRKHVEILEQIELAPRIYAVAAKEVVRRRDFASHFMKWSRTVAQESEGKYHNEITRRQEFSQFIGQHFLQNLFAGIHDLPIPFAQGSPELFDTELPPISSQELKELLSQVPELLAFSQMSEQNIGETSSLSFRITRSLSYDDLASVNQFNVEQTIDMQDPIETATTNNEETFGSSEQLQPTDTISRVEKASVCELPDTESAANDDESTEVRNNVDSAGQTLISRIIQSNVTVRENALRSIIELREDITKLASNTLSWRKDVDEFLSQQMAGIEELYQASERAKEPVEQTCETETMSDEMKVLGRKVSSLRVENESLRDELKAKEKTFNEEMSRYRTDLDDQKQLTREMESVKEKYVAEQQIRFNSAISKLMKEKELALKKATEKLSGSKAVQAKNEEKLQVLFNEKEELRLEKEKSVQKLAKASEEFMSEKLELEQCLVDVRQQLEEKEKLLAEYEKKDGKDAVVETEGAGSGQNFGELVVKRFQERIKHLEEENNLLKDRLHSAPDGSDKILFVELQQILEMKTRECEALRAELDLLQQRPRSSQVMLKDFKKDDIVEVYFNDEYKLHMVRCAGDTLYFVHPDSLVNPEIPADQLLRTSSFQAQVLDKEYCQAKKPNNRFKVTVGTKFYRVKVRPWFPEYPTMKI